MLISPLNCLHVQGSEKDLFSIHKISFLYRRKFETVTLIRENIYQINKWERHYSTGIFMSRVCVPALSADLHQEGFLPRVDPEKTVLRAFISSRPSLLLFVCLLSSVFFLLILVISSALCPTHTINWGSGIDEGCLWLELIQAACLSLLCFFSL